MANVEKKRQYKDKDGNTILEVENGADAKNVDITPIEGIGSANVQEALSEINDRLSQVEEGGGSGGGSSSAAAGVGYSNSASGLSATNVQSAIDELASAAEHELAASQLSPVQVWNDDFAADKTVSLYVEPYTNASGTYTHRIKSTPATTNAYQFHGTSVNRTNVYSPYVPFTKSGDKLVLNQCYTADWRETVWLVELVDANASIKIGFERFTFVNGEPPYTEYSNLTYVGGNARNQGSFTVDFGSKTIHESSMTLNPAAGKRYFIKFSSVDRTSFVSIVNANDSSESQTVQLGLDLRCSPYIEWVAGSFNVRKLCVTLYGGACDFFFTGDSIMYNVPSQVTDPANRWAYKFKAEKCPNTAISCRGMANHFETLLRLTCEILPLKPKCVIDENYANGFANAYLDIMKSVCEANGIEYIHTMPTISGTKAYNASDKQYIIETVRTIRFDEATSFNGDVTQGQDTAKFVNDKLHVNTKGSLAMYQRLIDELGL